MNTSALNSNMHCSTTSNVQKRRRIIFFSARYLPLVGGVENYTYNLSSQLAARGIQVDIVTCNLSGDPDVVTQENGVRVWRLPAHALMNNRLPLNKPNRKTKKLLDQLKESVLPNDECFVVVNTRFYPHSILGAHFARSISVQPLVLEHGSQYLTLGSTLLDCVIKLYEHGMSALTKLYKPLYAGVSLKACQWLKTFGIQTQLLVPNAIDIQEFRELASSRDFREEHSLDAESPLVTFVGRLCPEKGALALAQTAKELPCVQFLFAGEGPLRPEIEALKLPNLTLLGSLSKQDVSRLLGQSNCFCLPTRSEGFCTSLLEALAQECVPVISDVGGVKELIDARIGLIISEEARKDPQVLAQAITKALSLKEDPDKLKPIIHEKLSSYTWEASADALLAILDAHTSYNSHS